MINTFYTHHIYMHRPERSTDEVMSAASSRANVPFSWEKKPGMSKVKAPSSSNHYSLNHYLSTTSLKLTPPPRLSSQRSSSAVHPRSRSRSLCSNVDVQPSAASFRNSFKLNGGTSPTVGKEEDPFLAAFIKCTQMHSSSRTANNGQKYGADHHADGFSSGKKNTMFLMFTSTLSCKYSCAVRDDINVIVTMPRQSPK